MTRLLSLAAAIALAACASPSPNTAPSPPRLAMGPYEVTPPPAPWQPAMGPVGATFVHEESTPAHTMAIRVLPVVPPDEERDPAQFAEAARRYNEDRLNPRTSQLLQQSYAPVKVNGLDCIAYEVDGADMGVKEGFSVPFVIVGQLCRHAWHPDWIDVSFAERGAEGGGVRPEVREAGSKVLASLRARER